MTDCAPPEVSVIIPVMNESGSIPTLADEVTRAFEGSRWTWECLWIDDGSTDDSLQILRRLSRDDSRHRFLSHDTNHGQSAALLSGFAGARGRILATLDGDLQNDPADLPRLVGMLESDDADMVNGVRANRQDNALRKLSSKIANAFRNRVSGATATDVGCSVRVFYRECADGLPRFHGMHRFLPTLVTMRGFRVTETPVNHRPRVEGRTSYGIHNRLWVGIVDTLGVRWLVSRGVNPRVAEASDESQSGECRDA